MSIYKSLSTPVPTIAYCAMHQALITVPPAEYVKTMKELHTRIRVETDAINAKHGRAVHEDVMNGVEAIHRHLFAFLQTPISSDDKEIRRILQEGLENFAGIPARNANYGLKYSVEGRVFHVSTKKAIEKRLLQSGKTYLEDLGFGMGKGNGDLYESMFVVEGGVNLDVLEHIVRDRIGIYSMPHGKHIKEFAGYAYTAYNLLVATGNVPPRDAADKYFEATLFFSKPEMKYAPFRNALVSMVKNLSAAIALSTISLWQRKLGLGAGKEFVLRIISDDADHISRVVQWLDAHEGDLLIKDALTRDGKLVLKELLF